MPRKAIDYSKCKFYRLVCKDVTVKECYVGHTTNEVKRRRGHKTRCTNETDKNYNSFVYRFIRDHGSWDNWSLIVHETLAVENKAAALLRERYWLELYKAMLNQQVPGQTKAEYYVANIDEIKAVHAEYYAAHANEAKAKRVANEAHMKTKHNCACGGKYTTEGKSHHLKTAIHCTFITAQAAL